MAESMRRSDGVAAGALGNSSAMRPHREKVQHDEQDTHVGPRVI